MTLKIGTTYEHYEKYQALAERLGVEALTRIVLLITTREELADVLKIPTDKGWALNAIPLHKWDRCHGYVIDLLRKAGGGVWSQSDTVCTLKHVAKYHVAGAEFVGVCTFCKQPYEKYDAPHGRGDAICMACMVVR